MDKRINWYNKQRVDLLDMTTEQSYHIEKQKDAFNNVFNDGVITGLQVSDDSEMISQDTENSDDTTLSNTTNSVYQIFKATADNLQQVIIKGKKTSGATGFLRCSIYNLATPTDPVSNIEDLIGEVSINLSTLTTSDTEITFDFNITTVGTAGILIVGSYYAIKVSTPILSGGATVSLRYSNTDVYADGAIRRDTGSIVIYQNEDLYFKAYVNAIQLSVGVAYKNGRAIIVSEAQRKINFSDATSGTVNYISIKFTEVETDFETSVRLGTTVALRIQDSFTINVSTTMPAYNDSDYLLLASTVHGGSFPLTATDRRTFLPKHTIVNYEEILEIFGKMKSETAEVTGDVDIGNDLSVGNDVGIVNDAVIGNDLSIGNDVNVVGKLTGGLELDSGSRVTEFSTDETMAGDSDTVVPTELAVKTYADQPQTNKIINPNFDIWQRGTSFASIADGAYSSDRWVYNRSGAMRHTISQDTEVPNILSNYSMKIDCTTADASLANSDICMVSQLIEGWNMRSLKHALVNTSALSFWVRSTKTGTFCVALTNDGGGTPDRHIILEYTISASDTWEKKSISLKIEDGTSGTWDYENGKGLGVHFILAGKPFGDFSDNAGAWGSGEKYHSAEQVNACDSDSNNFYLSQVKLELGYVSTPFQDRPYGKELALCQRYYYRVTSTKQYSLFCQVVIDSDDMKTGRGIFTVPVPPRIMPPTVVSTNITYILEGDGDDQDISEINFSTHTADEVGGVQLGLWVKSAGQVGSNLDEYFVGSDSASLAYLGFDAEL